MAAKVNTQKIISWAAVAVNIVTTVRMVRLAQRAEKVVTEMETDEVDPTGVRLAAAMQTRVSKLLASTFTEEEREYLSNEGPVSEAEAEFFRSPIEVDDESIHVRGDQDGLRVKPSENKLGWLR